MSSSSDSSSLGKGQKLLLVVVSLCLVSLLLFLRNGYNTQKPLDSLARKSLPLEVALDNGRPTVLEFYADWCVACREMAPAILAAESIRGRDIDFVLLNVDNEQWRDYLELYQVRGIPQLNFFDDTGSLQGKYLGVRSFEQIQKILNALINKMELPEPFDSNIKGSQNNFSQFLQEEVASDNLIGPRSHV